MQFELSKAVGVSFYFGLNVYLSPHVRESRTLLDSGFQAVDSGFRVLDSGFQKALGSNFLLF